MNTKTRKILITSVGSGVGNAVLTAIQRSRRHYYVVSTNTEPFHSGVYRSDKVYLVKKSDVYPDEWVEKIIEIVKKDKPLMLIPGRDADVTLLSKVKERIEELGVKVMCSDKNIVEQSNDKFLTSNLFNKLGLQYAETVDMSDKKGLKRIINKYGFPLIAKPRFGTGTIGVKLVLNKSDIQNILDVTKPHEYLVQEYLPPTGPLHSITTMTPLIQDWEYSIQILFNPKGKIMGVFPSINTLENGLPVAVRVSRSTEIEDSLKTITSLNGTIVGPINIQGRVKNGKIVYFEANLRCTGITGTRAGLGFNEIDALWEAFVENKDVQMPTIPDGSYAYRNLEDTFFTKDQLNFLISNGSIMLSKN